MIGRNKVQPVVDAVTLQWANGKSLGRQVGGNGRFQPFVGWHIEAGKDPDGIDPVLHDLGIPRVEIKHQRQGGVEVVQHWSLGEEIRIHPVTSGPVAPTVAGSLGRNAAATAEAGIGVRWGRDERSKLAVRGYLDLLARAGRLTLVQLSVRSRMTDVLLGALLDHGRVCEAADGLVDRTRHPEVVFFHEIALPLGPGEEEEWGKGETTTVVPFRSAHPAAVDGTYLRGVWRPDAIHAAAQRDWAGIVAWAQEYATQGEAEAAGRAPAYDEPL